MTGGEREVTGLVEGTGAGGVHPGEEGEHCAAGLCQTRSLAFRNTGYPGVHHQHRAVVLVTSLLLEHGATRVLSHHSSTKKSQYDGGYSPLSRCPPPAPCCCPGYK